MKHQGIILQSLSSVRYTISIFDRSLGRLEGIVSDFSDSGILRPGLELWYYPRMRTRSYSLQELEIAQAPFESARIDVGFMHHMLELYYYFLPELSPMPIVFDLLQFLLNSPDMLQYPIYKKIMAVRFFVHIGIYPEHHKFPIEILQELMNRSVHEIMLSIDTEMEKLLETWIQACISMHPYSHRFKTFRIGHTT